SDGKAAQKELKRQWCDVQRAEARAALPLPFDELKAMFDMLDSELARCGCDHTRRLTRRWLGERCHDAELVFAWCDQHGCFCDCEVLANVEPHFDDAIYED